MDDTSGPPDSVAAIAALGDPTRRALYEMVAASEHPVGRDEAADAVSVARQTAAYHLDRLVAEGLLDVEYRRLSGRSGPGAGRPAKLYRRSDAEHTVSVPPRRYLVAAGVLLEAVASGALSAADLATSARRVGAALGGEEDLDGTLRATGYEPVTADDETRFRNCPFHALVQMDRPTTCALNHALVQGMVERSGDDRVAVLEPEDGYCCVRLRSRD